MPRFEAYKKAAWLGQRQAISILPSVGTLKALRTAKPSLATVPFIGFGNPLLDGIDGEDKSAWTKQKCITTLPQERIHTASRVADLSPILRNGRPSMETLRHQPPLPETADELCEIAVIAHPRHELVHYAASTEPPARQVRMAAKALRPRSIPVSITEQTAA